MRVIHSATRALQACALVYNGSRADPTVDKEKILVVDDEEAIREVVSTLLDAQGYE